jgi:transcriptional regulator with XRE-family HTH domain
MIIPTDKALDMYVNYIQLYIIQLVNLLGSKMPISADEKSTHSQLVHDSIKNKDNWNPVNIVILNRLRKRLKSIRKAHDHAQVDLAELIGIPVNIDNRGGRGCGGYRSYESGRSRIPLNRLYLVAKCYDISIDVFYQDAEPKIVPIKQYEGTLINHKYTEDDIYKAVGTRIRYLRVLSGETIADLAKILNRSQASVSMMEIAKTRIPIDQMYQIASHYNVLVSYFFQDLA